jgi:hypothetical protein
MKQQSKFKVSRPVLFALLYEKCYEELKKSLWHSGITSNVGTWGQPGVRKRVRTLARQMARSKMKELRSTEDPKIMRSENVRAN